MTLPSHNQRAVFLATIISSTLLMGSSFVAAKILLTHNLTPMILVGWRFMVAALAALPLVALDRGPFWHALLPRPVATATLGWVIGIGLLQTAGVMSLLFLAMQTISASSAAILLFTNPIWVAALSWLVLRETLGGSRLLGLALGAIGVALAIGVTGAEQGEGVVIGEVAALGAALCWAVATIVNKRVQLPIGVWALNFWQMLIGSLAILALAYIRNEAWPDRLSADLWGWFFWLAIPASTGSFGLWYLALSRGSATSASSFLFLAPVFTMICAYVVLGTSIAPTQFLGAMFIGVALWMVNR